MFKGEESEPPEWTGSAVVFGVRAQWLRTLPDTLGVGLQWNSTVFSPCGNGGALKKKRDSDEAGPMLGGP